MQNINDRYFYQSMESIAIDDSNSEKLEQEDGINFWEFVFGLRKHKVFYFR